MLVKEGKLGDDGLSNGFKRVKKWQFFRIGIWMENFKETIILAST